MRIARGCGISLLAAIAAMGLGCAPFGAPHTTLHPSRVGGTNAAGVSVGSVFTRTTSEPEGSTADVDTTSFAVPYGEGWARFGTGAGQLEVRATSNAVSVGYRADLSTSPSLTLGVQPSIGAGYWSTSSDADVDTGGNTSVGALTISPTLTFVVVLGGGAFYLGPRFGYQYSSFSVEDGDGDQTSTSSSSFAFGSALGTILDGAAFDYSFELGAYGYFGSGKTDTGTAEGEVDTSGFLLVATVGMQLGR